MHIRTRSRALLVVAPAALVLAAAAACSSSGSPSTAATTLPATSSPSGAASSSGAAASGAALTVTSDGSLGQIVTTGSGMTVYRYDADSNNPPKSNCTGGCAAAWPPVLATGSGTPSVSGVSGAVGEITRSDGSKQLTLDGWPLYTFASDSGAGSTSGQGVGGTWWAVTPAGAKAASGGAGAASSSASTSGGGGGGY